MHIGERLRKIRQDKGFSIYRLHVVTDISQNHISAIERARRQPSVETLRRLSKPLGITLAELFNDDEETFYLSDKERRLIMNFRIMADEKADAILEISRLLAE